MKNEVRVEIKDLDQAAGVELSAEELQAVTGGNIMEITGFSGKRKMDDEWIIWP
jgi:bacteriocin-like protein